MMRGIQFSLESSVYLISYQIQKRYHDRHNQDNKPRRYL